MKDAINTMAKKKEFINASENQISSPKADKPNKFHKGNPSNQQQKFHFQKQNQSQQQQQFFETEPQFTVLIFESYTYLKTR